MTKRRRNNPIIAAIYAHIQSLAGRGRAVIVARVRSFGGWINRLGPWVTAVASIVIAVVSLNLARQSNEQAYRAWVLINTVDRLELSATRPLTATVWLKNYGRSPALEVELYGKHIVAQRPPDPHAVVTNLGGGSKSVIGPDMKPPTRYTFQLSDQEVAAINGLSLHLYLYGVVRYADPFTRGAPKRRTFFCSQFDPIATAPSVNWDFCGVGNFAE